MNPYHRPLEQILHDIEESIARSHGSSTKALRHFSPTERTLLYRRYAMPRNLSAEGSLRLELISGLESFLSPHRVDGDWLPEDFPDDTPPDKFVFGPITSTAEFISRKLIESVAIYDSDVTARLLYDFSDGAPFTHRRHILISGATIDKPMVIDSGVSIDRLSGERNDISARLPHMFDPYAPSPRWTTEAILSFDSDEYPVQFQGHCLMRLAYALSLGSDQPICCILDWSDFGYPDLASLSVGHVAYTFDKWRKSIVALSRKEVTDGVKLYLDKLHNWNVSPGLGVAIHRWHRSKLEEDTVDQCWNLRLALERALNINGTKIARRLSGRGASYLEVSRDDQEQRKYQLKAAYDLCSRASHYGQVEENWRNLRLIADAQTLCREVIVKRLVEDKAPEWASN